MTRTATAAAAAYSMARSVLRTVISGHALKMLPWHYLAVAASPCPAESDPSLLPWASPDSWPGGIVPAPGDNATLLPGMRLLLSSAEAPAAAPLNLSYVEVQENATLVIATHDASAIHIRLLGMTVRGELRAGLQACPIGSVVTIELMGEKLRLEDRGSPPSPEIKGLYITGNGVANLHGASVGTRGWTRLASPHAVNATSLHVRAGAEAWPAGGRVVIATTHFRDHFAYSENEVRTITGVSAYAGYGACVADANAAGRDPSLCAVTELYLDAPLAHAEERTRKREARDIVRFRVGLRGVRRGDTPRVMKTRCGGEVSRCSWKRPPARWRPRHRGRRG